MTTDVNTVAAGNSEGKSEAANTRGERPNSPVARRKPEETRLHGDLRVDDYGWLREKENPEVIEYLKAENEYSDAALRLTEGLQEKLYQEMLGRILQTDLSVPYVLRGYRYFTRTEEGKQYPLHCRQRNMEGAAEEILLDLNALAEGHSFLGLGATTVSDDTSCWHIRRTRPDSGNTRCR